MGTKLRSCLVVIAMATVLAGPSSGYAKSIEEKPSGFAMIGDLVVARPLGLAILAVGSVAYVVSLPFSIAGGNAKETARTLVIDPARETFIRCLGCTRLGRKEKITE